MGYDRVIWRGEVHARVSRHNSWRDERDNKLWDEMRERLEKAVEEISTDPKYEGLEVFEI